MPRGDPFTALCQQTALLSRRVAADLHLHTIASDGSYTPSQVVAFARAAKLDAIAVTDHDTFAGVGDAVAAAAGSGLRVISGVEITAEWDGNEVHVLGLFARTSPPVPLSPGRGGVQAAFPPDPFADAQQTSHVEHPLCPGRGGRGVRSIQDRLNTLCLRRRERFHDFLRLLRDDGHAPDAAHVTAFESATVSLGRRHVATLLVRCGLARSYGEAWGRFVAPLSRRVMPKLMIPVAEAAELVQAAGGVAVIAHPSADFNESDFTGMKTAGLDGIEVKFPAAGVGRTRELAEVASRLGLLTTGGSDCHGPDGRPVGAIGASAAELRAVCDAPVGEGAH